MAADIPSLVIALLAAIAAGLVGAFALMKRMTLAGDVISHLALPGLGAALLWNIDPFLGGGVTLFLGTLLVWRLGRSTMLASETAIGVVFAAAVAFGTLLTPEEELIEALFGGFHVLSRMEFFLGLAAAIAAIAFLWKWKDRLIVTLFSPDLAAASGVNVPRTDLWFLLAFSATVLLGLQFLGALLMGALVIIPAAAARNVAGTLQGFLATSAAVSVISVASGFAVAMSYEFALGPTIIMAASGLFLLSLMYYQWSGRSHA